jgi:hypothetical protein
MGKYHTVGCEIMNRLVLHNLIKFSGFLLNPDLRLEDDQGHGPKHVRLLLHLRRHLARLRVQVPLLSDITTSSRTRTFRRWKKEERQILKRSSINSTIFEHSF